MRVVVSEDSVEVRLAGWEKVLGLMGSIRLDRAELGEVRLVEEPLRELSGRGLKVGLRLPGLYYVARTIRLDEAFIVRRGVPALSFTVRNREPLRRVLVSTPDAAELARRLGAG